MFLENTLLSNRSGNSSGLKKIKKSLQSCSPVFFHPPPKTEPHVMLFRLGFFSGLICRAAGTAEGCQGAEVGMSEGGRSALGRLCSQMFPSVGRHLRVQKRNLKCFGRQLIKQIREDFFKHFQELFVTRCP